MKYPREWEPLEEKSRTERLKVPNGWLIFNRTFGSMTHLPDPNHEWELEDEK